MRGEPTAKILPLEAISYLYLNIVGSMSTDFIQFSEKQPYLSNSIWSTHFLRYLLFSPLWPFVFLRPLLPQVVQWPPGSLLPAWEYPISCKKIAVFSEWLNLPTLTGHPYNRGLLAGGWRRRCAPFPKQYIEKGRLIAAAILGFIRLSPTRFCIT